MRPNDRNVGYARRVIPTSFWVAPKLMATLSHVGLDDKKISGGYYDRVGFGVN